MHLAWFRELPLGSATPDDETAPCIRVLGHTHEIEIFTEANAHDFPWMQHRRPYDLCIYEYPQAYLGSFVHAYAVHYPGLVSLPGERARGFGAAAAPPPRRPRMDGSDPVRIAAIGGRAATAVAHAVARAGDLGANLELVTGDIHAIPDSDIVLAMAWPSGGESLMPALAAMAAAKPVVVYEVEATAGWPAFDPQTWRPRGPGGAPPAVVSVDVRDAEHSLLLAIRRLAADAVLREQLGAGAHAWWAEHGTVEGAAREWERLIAAAVAAPQSPPTPPPDGTAHARDVLARFGLRVSW